MATAHFTPCDDTGKPLPGFGIVAGGQATGRIIRTTVTNGGLSTPLIASADTSPTNVSYLFSVEDPGGRLIYGPYIIQPTNGGFNLDNIEPIIPAQKIIQTGPTGPQGLPGDSAYITLEKILAIGDTTIWFHGLNSPKPEIDFAADDSSLGYIAGGFSRITCLDANRVETVSIGAGLVTGNFRFVAPFAPRGPVHHYPMNEGTGILLNDSGLTPDSFRTVLTPDWVTGLAGVPGGIAPRVSGKNYACTNPSPFDITTPFSISCFVNTDLSENSIILSTLVGDAVAKGVTFLVTATGALQLQLIHDASATAYCVALSTTNPVVKFTSGHVGVSYDGSGVAAGIRFYFAGLPIAGPNQIVGDTLFGNSFNSGLPSHLGHNADSSTGSFPGVVAGLRIYDYAISDAQMLANSGVL
jgi:hypothetical protein